MARRKYTEEEQQVAIDTNGGKDGPAHFVRFKFDSSPKGFAKLTPGHLSAVGEVGNVMLHKVSTRAMYRTGYYKNKFKTRADLVTLPDWFDINEILEIDDNALHESLNELKDLHDDANKEKLRKYQDEHNGIQPTIGSLLENNVEKASKYAKDNLWQIYKEPKGSDQQKVSNAIKTALQAGIGQITEKQLIDELFEHARIKRERLLGRIDCVYPKGALTFRKVEGHLLKKAEYAALNNQDPLKYLDKVKEIRAKKLALAQQKYPTDAKKFRAFLDGMVENLVDLLDEEDLKDADKLYKDAIAEIDAVAATQGPFSRKSKPAFMLEMLCDPGALALPYGTGFMLKYTNEAGMAVFTFMNIPKEQRPRAIQTMFRVLNDPGDWWRGDVIITGPAEFQGEVTAVARDNSLRISSVHGTGTHRLLYEQIKKEIASDPSKYGQGVIAVSALVFKEDHNGKPYVVKNAYGEPESDLLAIGSRSRQKAGGWGAPENLLKRFNVDKYPPKILNEVTGEWQPSGIDFPESPTAEQVYTSYGASGQNIPGFGVIIPENDDNIADSRLVSFWELSKEDQILVVNYTNKLRHLARREMKYLTNPQTGEPTKIWEEAKKHPSTEPILRILERQESEGLPHQMNMPATPVEQSTAQPVVQAPTQSLAPPGARRVPSHTPLQPGQ